MVCGLIRQQTATTQPRASFSTSCGRSLRATPWYSQRRAASDARCTRTSRPSRPGNDHRRTPLRTSRSESRSHRLGTATSRQPRSRTGQAGDCELTLLATHTPATPQAEHGRRPSPKPCRRRRATPAASTSSGGSSPGHLRREQPATGQVVATRLHRLRILRDEDERPGACR